MFWNRPKPYLLQREVDGEWETIQRFTTYTQAYNVLKREQNNPNNLTEWRIEIEE